jgi:hypothetical protein
MAFESELPGDLQRILDELRDRFRDDDEIEF